MRFSQNINLILALVNTVLNRLKGAQAWEFHHWVFYAIKARTAERRKKCLDLIFTNFYFEHMPVHSIFTRMLRYMDLTFLSVYSMCAYNFYGKAQYLLNKMISPQIFRGCWAYWTNWEYPSHFMCFLCMCAKY